MILSQEYAVDANLFESCMSLVRRLAEPVQETEIAALLSTIRPMEFRQLRTLTWVEDDRIHGILLVCIKQDGTGQCWPPWIDPHSRLEVRQELLTAGVAWLDSQHVRFTQMLTPPDDQRNRVCLGDSGFEYLGELIGMEHDLQTLPVPCDQSELNLIDHHAATTLIFEQVMEETFERSLDCLELRGRRSARDCFDSHRLSTTDQQRYWKVCRVSNEYAGLILCAEHHEERFWELLYLGVVPKFRRQRFGFRMLVEAMRCAKESGAGSLVLGVDSANQVAVDFYKKLGFIETFRRTLHVRFRPTSHPN